MQLEGLACWIFTPPQIQKFSVDLLCESINLLKILSISSLIYCGKLEIRYLKNYVYLLI